MTKKNKPATSSYDRIAKLLAGTDDFKNLVADAKLKLSEATILRIDYRAYKREEDVPTARAQYVFAFGLSLGTEKVETLDLDTVTESAYLRPKHILTDELLTQVFNRNFGSTVKTFNCKRDEALKKFTEWVDEQRDALLGEEVRAFLKRVAEEHRDLPKSEGVLLGLRQASEKVIVDDIRSVLQKYYGKVDNDIINHACEQVVAGLVMVC